MTTETIEHPFRFTLIAATIGVAGIVAAGAASCIIPDKDITFNPISCGHQWCITIPTTGNGAAWGDGPMGQDALVQEIVDSQLTAIKRCICTTSEEHAILTEGCAGAPCDPEWDLLIDEVQNLTYEACITAAVEDYNPDLGQDTMTVTAGNTCLEATQYWVPAEDTMADLCPIPVEECEGSTGVPLDDGGGPEPFGSYSITCAGGVCTVPNALLEDWAADPNIVIDSATRLEQKFSGSPPASIGFEFTGVVSSSIAYKLGFRSRDIVQEVNGVTMTQLSDFVEVFVELRSSETATVKVKRASSTIYLNFQREQPWP